MGRAAKVPCHVRDVQDRVSASLLGSAARDAGAWPLSPVAACRLAPVACRRLSPGPCRLAPVAWLQARGLRPEEAARKTLTRCGSQRGLLLVAHVARKGTARR